MIVKSFAADTVAGALKKVRSELGGEAVILRTRKIETDRQRQMGGRVEVTACVDKSGDRATLSEPKTIQVQRPVHDIPTKAIKNSNASFPAEAITHKLDFLMDLFQMPIRRQTYSRNFSRIFSAMIDADIPEYYACEITDKLRDKMSESAEFDDLRSMAIDLICENLPSRKSEQRFKIGDRIVFVGPSGSGKTSTMGRLAGHLIANEKLPVNLTSLDQVKVSAPEEFHIYADILDVDYFDMPRHVDKGLLDSLGKDKITIIDTPALNRYDTQSIALYAEKLARIRADRVVGIFPAWFRASDLMECLLAYQPLGFTELAVTMTDQTHRLGGILTASIQTGLPIAMVGAGTKAGQFDAYPEYRPLVQSLFGRGEGF
ncbi:MAG: hypothetical protein V3V99_05625 [candidate division Zixibacteria bacterium]